VLLASGAGNYCWPVLLASGAGQYNSIVGEWCWPVLLACGAGPYCAPSPFAAQIWSRKWFLFLGRRFLANAKNTIIISAIIIIIISIVLVESESIPNAYKPN
jgi:hypothetical protein